MTRRANDAVEARLEWAIQIAEQAGALTLQYFRRTDLAVERKADDSPVTIADRQAEELLRRLIAERFPDDSILGEELGATDGSSGFQWVLDPIDGTKSFIHGVPLYTTLVAVLEGDEPRIGVINAPACGELAFASTGGGCWYVADAAPTKGPQPARVSQIDRLSEGLLLTSEVASFATGRVSDASDVYQRLERSARLARTWGDGYGYLMVATGRAEVMIDPVMNLWDTAALEPIIREAGGHFVDWQGEETIYSGDAIATNGRVTEEVLRITKT
jgi:histidinol phosphatase-like enzyme (inositol monophosphatase family)